MRRPLAVALALACAVVPASAAQLRIGLGGDPDLLDPATGGSYVGRIVFASLCDKLIDLDARMGLVPQLATKWEWSADNMTLTIALRDGVSFHDGETLDAEAVRVNLERYRNAPESQRRAELRPIAAIEVLDRLTVRLRLSAPNAPLVAVLADRAGMIASPKALARLGKEFGTEPVCAGPFRFTQRVAQDRIVLDRFPGYWDAAKIHVDRITFRPIPDTTVKLVNLRSGQLDLIEGVAPSDAAAVKSDVRLRLLSSPAVAYQVMLFNLGNGRMAEGPFGRDPRVREAFEKSIDRDVMNRVVLDGLMVPSNQTEAPGTPYWNPAIPVPARDLPGARALLKAAGAERVPVTLLVGNAPIPLQTAELIQSMAGEAGFDVKIIAMEANAAVAAARAGEYNAYIGIWSGRADPDGNVANWLQSDGFLNWGKYLNPDFDALLARARAVTDVAARQPLYREVAATYTRDRPFMVMYHHNWLFAHGAKLSGFTPVPDGLVRPQGIRVGE